MYSNKWMISLYNVRYAMRWWSVFLRIVHVNTNGAKNVII